MLRPGTLWRILSYTISIVIVLNISSLAQHQEIYFKHLSTVDGLSNFTVLSIAQDRNGFMWFGTMDGLNRFDGKQIKTYRLDKDDPYSLGNNLIHSLWCSSDSGLWVGTGQGLYYYDFYHDNFHSIPILDQDGNENEELEIKTMVQDQTDLWVGTSQGLFKYDLVHQKFDDYLINKVERKVISETIETIHKSDNGIIWIGGKEGLFYIKDEQCARLENDPYLKYNNSTNVISIVSDKKGRIWFGTLDRNTGLMIYDPVTGEFTDLNTRDGYIPHNKVNRLYRLDDGKIWAGTTWGLAIIDENTYESQQLSYERKNPGSISHNSVRDIFLGDNEILWIGTYSGGVNYFDKRSQQIKHETNVYDNEFSLSYNIVSAIFEDGNRDLWIGTEYGGLNIYKQSEKKYKVLRRKKDPNSLKSNNIKSIVEDEEGRKFIATQFGLSIYDPVTNSFFNIDDKPGPRGRLNFYGVLDLCKDNSGNIWIGTHKWIGTSKLPGPGYYLMYDTKRDTVIHYYPKSDDLGIVEGGVNSMIYDSIRDIIWSGGDNGLTAFDNKELKYLTNDKFFEAVSVLEGIVINDLYLDGNLLWIATFGQGLYIMDVETFVLRKIQKDEGLIESSFYAITGDNRGNIWASVSAYLLKIETPKDIKESINDIEKYGIQEGFPPQQYFRNAAFKGKDGTLFFGGDDGYIAFSPHEVENIVFNPSVEILDVFVNGETLEVKSDKDNQHLNIASLKNLSLTYDQSSFSIHFIATNYINPDNTWYQYQLSSIHDTWQDLGTSNTINFTKLKAGEYDLKLRASSDPKNFAEEFTSINIQVDSPYWGTPLAYFIYLIIILILLYLFFVITRKWERLNQSLRFEYIQREQEKEFNQQRLKFFTDVSHELRTPLTLILAPLERIIQSNFGNAKIKNQLLLMLRNGDRMLQLINQLLDLRKLETGHMELKAAKGNIVRFVNEVSLSFRELAQNKSIEFEVASEQPKLTVWFDRDKFEIILFNLFSNALKFTPDHGKIGIFIGKNNPGIDANDKGVITIAIENSGRGIPSDQVDHIFERYYSGQAENEPRKAGSGVGLEIVKNLVDLHKGTIVVDGNFDENGVEGHTRFTLQMKVGKDHLSKNELLKNYKSSEDIANYIKPVSRDVVAKEKQTEENDQERGKKEGTLLIIEDNHEVRALVVGIFAKSYTILEAENGNQGLELANEHLPDLIISDIMMPGIDGIELCRKIKTGLQTSHIPVILLTARTAVTFRYEGLETGADDYIVKPFSIEELHVRAVNLIKQRRNLRERFSQSGLVLPNEISLTSVDEKLLQGTIDYVIENIDNSELTVDIIAKNVGMSRTNFYRKVKALTGMSASEFLRKIRMDRAAQLLKTNKIRVSEVRFMVGIKDPNYFRECFKKQFGLTPKEYIDSE